MVKFSKQFEGQLVPEWKQAFVDYWTLKKDLNKMHLSSSNQGNIRQSNSRSSFCEKLGSFFAFLWRKQRQHGGIIQVHWKLAESSNSAVLYETELLQHFADTDAAREFFECLDLQLNKVNKFFRVKEEEFLERGDLLKKQLEILIELKTVLTRKHDKRQTEEDSVSCDEAFIRDAEQALESSEENVEFPEFCEIGKSSSVKKDNRKMRSLSGRIFNYQGKSLRIHIPVTNPSLSYLFWDDLVNQSSKKCGPEGNKLHVSKKRLRHAEKMIRGAFIELYKGLGYLKTYRNLNLLAFSKILKKFDKVTNKQVLSIYLKVVESSYFNTSDKVLKLADEVEDLFVKNFAEDDRRKAMKYLKPALRKEESLSSTFFIGLFTGCFLALLIGYTIMAHVSGMYKAKSNTMYMETVYPVLSMFSLLFLHLFLYGCNIVMWRKTRINYSFIFELSPTKELKSNDVFLICAISLTAVIGILFVHLSLVAKGYSYAQVQSIPGLLLLAFISVLVCPLNIIYKSSRYRFLSIIRNIILSPLYKVVMLDFFMADQLCSQVPMLRDLEYIACYYITASYKTQDYGYCRRTTYFRDLAYAVSFLPYYWRAMQCARRWFDEGDMSHVLNLGKYVSAMLAAGTKVAYEKEMSTGWLCLVVIMSSGATIYQLYWDFVKDWGLLQFNSKNQWLRDELMLGKKFIYYISMGVNLVLRLAWLQTVVHYKFGEIDYRVSMLFLAALEVVRRGQWNFYRLENEHVNNVGKFRAVKTVPLPFHEVDDQD